MSKSLKTIQTISKVAKVISNIIFIFSIIGAVACILAASALAGSQNIMLEGQSMVNIIESTGINFVTFMFSCIVSFFACIGSAVIAKFASTYFTNELEDGTPFTHAGAKELRRLGILAIVIPLAISILTSLTFTITKIFWPILSEDALSSEPVSIVFGLMLIVMSVVFKHGAEIVEKLYNNN